MAHVRAGPEVHGAQPANPSALSSPAWLKCGPEIQVRASPDTSLLVPLSRTMSDQSAADAALGGPHTRVVLVGARLFG